MIEALCEEMTMRKLEVNSTLETIYFGGGTPGIIKEENVTRLMEHIRELFEVRSDAEITLEVNPEDVNTSKLSVWKSIGINRLSIGIQSFQDRILHWMNRAHTAQEAMEAVQLAQKHGFDEITVDLIYGIPGMTTAEWTSNIEQVTQLKVQHVSAYCLTVEPGTALAHQIRTGRINAAPDDQSIQELSILTQWVKSAGGLRYEISNFAFEGHIARHNTNYWKGKPYLGIGPSAHSFDGDRTRRWNVANNNIYLRSVRDGLVDHEREVLSDVNRFNEHMMTGLRTMWGVNFSDFPDHWRRHLEMNVKDELAQFEHQGWLEHQSDRIWLTHEGWLRADAIAAELFMDAD